MGRAKLTYHWLPNSAGEFECATQCHVPSYGVYTHHACFACTVIMCSHSVSQNEAAAQKYLLMHSLRLCCLSIVFCFCLRAHPPIIVRVRFMRCSHPHGVVDGQQKPSVALAEAVAVHRQSFSRTASQLALNRIEATVVISNPLFAFSL